MNLRRLTSLFAALTLAGTGLIAAAAPTQATSTDHILGTRSLAQVLAVDGHGFDHNSRDFDIADKFVMRVLAAKPHSRLAIVTRGGQPVTAFLPTDGAFRRATVDIVGKRFASERRVFRALWHTAGLRGAENVLLYHLVPGHTLTYRQLRLSAPTTLATLQGGTLRIRDRQCRLLVLDRDNESPNARVMPGLSNINKGNRQIAHGISSMLSPVVG